jgi:hypothetical protein
MDGQPFDDAKEAGKSFVQIVDLTRNQVAVVSFASEAQMEIPLGRDIGALETTIDAMENDHGSTISAGINMAHEELLSARHNPAAGRVMIILSDGEGDESAKITRKAADAAKAQGIRIITIRLGDGSGEALMHELASPNDDHNAATSADLQAIYKSIATPLSGCGSSDPAPTPTAGPSPTPAPAGSPVPCEADTYINADSPDKDYGDARVMKASAGEAERWALVRCQASTAPVRRVTLRLYVLEEAEDVHIFSTSDNWDEHTTWNRRPQIDDLIGSLDRVAEGKWVEVDVTRALQPDGSLSLVIQTDSEHNFEIATRERGKGPQLIIEPAR